MRTRKEAIRAFPNLKPSIGGDGAGPTAVAAPQGATSGTRNPLPDYAQKRRPEVKLEIEYLLDLALQHGIGKAISESEKSPYFVQDAFHDSLAGKLYPELQKRGIVK